MISSEVIQNNRESWAELIRFVEEFPNSDQWRPYKSFMTQVIQAGIREGLNDSFRAGQSMSHVIFSTAERHRLELCTPAPPRVTLRFSLGAGASVAWSHTNVWFHEPERQEPVTSETVLLVLKKFLVDLWSETRSTQSLPQSLAQGKLQYLNQE